MKSRVTVALLAVGIALAVSAATAVPAAAATSGSETVSGRLVTSGVSGTRTAIATVAVAKGVFNGVGRIVEIPSLPTDPPNVARDDLVYPEGTMHFVSTSGEPTSFSLNPHNCMFKVTVPQTGEIMGGTGQFTNAAGSFTGTLTAQGLGARSSDGSCDPTQPALHEVDMIASSGTLSF